jgi:hypothetical protein
VVLEEVRGRLLVFLKFTAVDSDQRCSIGKKKFHTDHVWVLNPTAYGTLGILPAVCVHPCAGRIATYSVKYPGTFMRGSRIYEIS